MFIDFSGYAHTFGCKWHTAVSYIPICSIFNADALVSTNRRTIASVLIDMCKILFWGKTFYHNNVILHSRAVECRQSITAIADKHNITIYDIVYCNNFMLI